MEYLILLDNLRIGIFLLISDKIWSKYADYRSKYKFNKKSALSFSNHLYNENDCCPIHLRGKHTWKECRDNQYGPNFTPSKFKKNNNCSRNNKNFRKNGRSQPTNINNSSGGSRSDQHFQEASITQTNTTERDNDSIFSPVLATATNPDSVNPEFHVFQKKYHQNLLKNFLRQ